MELCQYQYPNHIGQIIISIITIYTLINHVIVFIKLIQISKYNIMIKIVVILIIIVYMY